MKITVRHVLDLILSKNFIGVEMTIALVRVSNLNIQLKLTKSIAIIVNTMYQDVESVHILRVEVLIK